MNEELKKKVDTLVGFSRLAGGVAIIVGSLLVFFAAQAALDPNAVIEVNGVPTKKTSDKIMAVIFTALFPILGLFLSFAPDPLMDKLAAKAISRLS